MSRDLRRLAPVFVAVALWGIATWALADALGAFTQLYAAMVRSTLGLLGVACVREGTTLYVPGHSTTVTFADTGIFWWGALAGLALVSRWRPPIKALAFAGALIVLTLIQVAYGLTLTVARHGLVAATQAAWMATLFSLLALASVQVLGPVDEVQVRTPGPGAA
jgi:hypothetical protein